MADQDYCGLLLKHLGSSRRMLVDSLMGEAPPTPQQLRELADVQQAITAVEAVIAEQDAASGGIPLRRA
jgi:hypothetical protein